MNISRWCSASVRFRQEKGPPGGGPFLWPLAPSADGLRHRLAHGEDGGHHRHPEVAAEAHEQDHAAFADEAHGTYRHGQETSGDKPVGDDGRQRRERPNSEAKDEVDHPEGHRLLIGDGRRFARVHYSLPGTEKAVPK